MSRLLFMKTLPQQLAQPTGIAIAASLGLHALLGLSLPSLSKASKQAEQNPRGNVKVMELTPAEESRVPSLAPSPTSVLQPPPLPYESQPLPPLPPSLSSYYPPLSPPDCSVNSSPTSSRRKKGVSNSPSSLQAKGEKGVKSSSSRQYCLDDLLASVSGITKPPKSIQDTARSLKDKDSRKKLDKTSDRQSKGTSVNDRSSGNKVKLPDIDNLIRRNTDLPKGLNSSGDKPENIPNLPPPHRSSETASPSSPETAGDNAESRNSYGSTSLLSQALQEDRTAKLKTGDDILRGTIDYPPNMGCSEKSLSNAIKGFVIVDRDGNIARNPQMTPPSNNEIFNQQVLAKVRAHQFPKADKDEPAHRIYQFRFNINTNESCSK